MPRVKGGYVTRRRRNRILKLAKGYFGSKHTLYKTANQQVMKSLSYAYRDRKRRKRDFRRLWIARINAAARINGLSYNNLMYGLKVANIQINRKMLAELAINEPSKFAAICESVKPSVNAHYEGIKAKQLADHEAKVKAEEARKAEVAKARELRNADK